MVRALLEGNSCFSVQPLGHDSVARVALWNICKKSTTTHKEEEEEEEERMRRREGRTSPTRGREGEGTNPFFLHFPCGGAFSLLFWVGGVFPLYTCKYLSFFSIVECLCLTIHIATALHLLLSVFFSRRWQRVYRRNTTCTMIIHVCTAHHRCQAQNVEQDTEQKHGKHGCGAPLSSVVVLAEHGGCLSSVDRDRELRIWSEREARRHECETRGWWVWNERGARRNECETR